MKRAEETLLCLLAAGIAALNQRPTEPLSDRHDVAAALALARRWGLGGLASTGAAACGFDDGVTRDRETRAAGLRKSMVSRANANRVSALLHDAGVAHVFFKGVASDEVLFGGRGLRGGTDIDVLVSDLEEAQRALAGIAIGAASEARRPRLRSIKRTRTIPVMLMGARAVLDVHGAWLITPMFVDDTPAILSRAVRVAGALPRPAFEDYAAYIGGNLVQDGFSGRLRLAVDLAMLATSQALDWGVVVERARRSRVGGALWALTRFVERALMVRVPADVTSLRPPAWRRALLRASASGAAIPGAVTRSLEGDSLVRGLAHAVDYVPQRVLDKLLDE